MQCQCLDSKTSFPFFSISSPLVTPLTIIGIQ